MKRSHRRTQSNIECSPVIHEHIGSSETHKILNLLQQPQDLEKQIIIEEIDHIETDRKGINTLGIQLQFGQNKKQESLKKYIPQTIIEEQNDVLGSKEFDPCPMGLSLQNYHSLKPKSGSGDTLQQIQGKSHAKNISFTFTLKNQNVQKQLSLIQHQQQPIQSNQNGVLNSILNSLNNSNIKSQLANNNNQNVQNSQNGLNASQLQKFLKQNMKTLSNRKEENILQKVSSMTKMCSPIKQQSPQQIQSLKNQPFLQKYNTIKDNVGKKSPRFNTNSLQKTISQNSLIRNQSPQQDPIESLQQILQQQHEQIVSLKKQNLDLRNKFDHFSYQKLKDDEVFYLFQDKSKMKQQIERLEVMVSLLSKNKENDKNIQNTSKDKNRKIIFDLMKGHRKKITVYDFILVLRIRIYAGYIMNNQ